MRIEVIDTYTVQIGRESGADPLWLGDMKIAALMAETEENLTDLLPAGYRARIRRWNEPTQEEDDE